jgi:hypothetical protein
MTEVADLAAAVRHIVGTSASGGLPFDWLTLGEVDGRLEIAVEPSEEAAAVAFFQGIDLTLADGTPVTVAVEVRAGMAWGSEPLSGAVATPDRRALDGLLGADVNTAAARANAGGWIVRAYQEAAILTADYRPNRVNLLVDDHGRVTRAGVG